MAYYLNVQSGPQLGTRFPLDPHRPIHLGRGSTCEVLLTDPRSSRFHAVMFYEDGSWHIRDSSSRNGTQVNEQKIDEARLNRESQIQIGDTRFFIDEVSDAESGGDENGQTIVGDAPPPLESPDTDVQLRSGGDLPIELYCLAINHLRRGDFPESVDTALELVTNRIRFDIAEVFLVSESGRPRLLARYPDPEMDSEASAAPQPAAADDAQPETGSHVQADSASDAGNVSGAKASAGAASASASGQGPRRQSPSTLGGPLPPPNAKRVREVYASVDGLEDLTEGVRHLTVPLLGTDGITGVLRLIAAAPGTGAISGLGPASESDLGDPDSDADRLPPPSRSRSRSAASNASGAVASPTKANFDIHESMYGTTNRFITAAAIARLIAAMVSNDQRTPRPHTAPGLISPAPGVDAVPADANQNTDFIGDSAPVKQLKARIQRVGPAGGAVLIRGESGSGKELVAAAVHRAGRRADRPMLAVNCAAIPANLIESQLFGHKRGAFTGADTDHDGYFRQADGGTLFLDEIGELPLEGQAKLLRILEGHPFLPVGGTKEIAVDVRVIAATNRDLAEFVRERKFREDLFFRLTVFELMVPPLRDRGKDIATLVDHFMQFFRRRHGRPDLRLSDQARDKMLQYAWPGNVRQLRNVIDSAVVMADDPEILLEDLGIRDAGLSRLETLRIDQWEERLIRRALDRSGGSVPQAAKLLGISRATAYRKLAEYNIDKKAVRTG